MKKLQLGIITNKEMADWFGIQPSAFSSRKQQKLKQLAAYADFQEVGNKQKKIKINKIYEEEYHKRGSQDFEKIKSRLNEVWSDDGLDSCKRVSEEIVKTTALSVKQNTAYKYTIKSRNDLFGKPFQTMGKLGSCKYVWCKKDDETGELRWLTPEQEKIKEETIKKYFGDASEKQIIVQGMVESGEINKEEAWEVLTELTQMKGSNFLGFLRELEQKIGCRVIKGTYVERLEQKSAWDV